MESVSRRQKLLADLCNHVTEEIETRLHELDMFFLTGIAPAWAICKSKDFLDAEYLDARFLEHYYKMCNYELLGRCKSFELFPALSFNYA
jgi:hypothetical protein